MITKHTPGPWTIHKDYSRANYTVFDADGNYGDTSVETIDANAALIAAAPDLLAALEGARAEARRVVHPTAVDDRLYRIDRILTAAIAKMEGQ